jgi:type IV pilus assembly protein PilW
MPAKTPNLHSDSRGFTLIELLMAITIGILIIAALFGFFWMQRTNADLQQDVAATQQDLRGLSQILGQNIRMAGYNPQGRAILPFDGGGQFTPGFQKPAVAGNFIQFRGAQTANVTTDGQNIAFVADIDGNGRIGIGDAPLEQIAYRFVPAQGRLEQFSPTANPAWQPVAEYIDGVQFLYHLSNGNDVTDPLPAQLDNIRAVTVTILARAAFPKRGFTNNTIYRPASCPANLAPNVSGLCPDGFHGDSAWNDNFLRQMLIFTVQCRNM